MRSASELLSWLDVGAAATTGVVALVTALEAFLALKAKKRVRARVLSATTSDPELRQLISKGREDKLKEEHVEAARGKIQSQIDQMSPTDRWLLKGALTANTTLGVKRFVTNTLPVKRVIVSEPEASWRKVVIDRLNHLVMLRIGWDGYKGEPVRFETANFALRLLDAVCSYETPSPQIVPGISGDLQLEWHIDQIDIELHVKAPNSVHAWRSADQSGQDGEEFELTNNFTTVAKWISELGDRTSATKTAAA